LGHLGGVVQYFGSKSQVAMWDMQFSPSVIKFWVIWAALYNILGQNHKLQCEICSFHSQKLNFGSSARHSTIFWVKIATCNMILKFPLPDLIFWVILAVQNYILGQNCYLQHNIPISTPRPHILGQNPWMQYKILLSTLRGVNKK